VTTQAAAVAETFTRARAEARALTRPGFLSLAFLIASFAYELPLTDILPYHRVNPRLFDVAAVWLLFYWFFFGRSRGWRMDLGNAVVKPWIWITVFYGLATFASALFIPREIYFFSLFYYAKYLEGLAVILVVSSAPLDERERRGLLKVALAGGIWVSAVAVLQYAGVLSTTRYLPDGEEIPMYAHGIYSTLGWTYFHVGMYSVATCLIGFALFSAARSAFERQFALAGTLACVIPAIISGSRAGLLALGFSLLLVVFRSRFRRRFLSYALLGMVLLMGAFFYLSSITKERLETGRGGSVAERLMHGPNTLVGALAFNGPKLLLVGGGFYVVPLPLSGNSLYAKSAIKYRKGYGNHNIFFFPLEQAGIGAFVAAIWFWVATRKALAKAVARSRPGSLDEAFADSMRVYLVAMLIVGFAGQVFWLGFGTEHFTIYQVILFVLASKVGARDAPLPARARA
jgi:hypothetical protein